MQQVAWKPGSAIEEEHPRPKPEQQSHGGAALLAPEQEFAGYGMANFEVAGQPALRDREPANYDETTAHEKTGIFVKPDGTFHAAPEKTSIFVKDGGTFITGGKNYVIGAYTYEDILASAWLREMYGHLIGLAKTGEETRGSIQQNTQRDDSERSEGGSNPKEEGRGGGGGKKTGKNAETPKKTEERPPMMRNGKYYTIDLKGAAEELSKSKQGFLNMPGRGKKTESGQEPEARNESGKEKKEAHEAAKKGHGLGKKGGRTGKNTLEIPLRKPNGTQENWGAKKRQRKESMKMQNAGEASENARLRRASAGRRRKGASEKFAKEEMRKTDRLLRKLLKGRRAKRRRLLALALWKSSGEASKKRQKMPKKKNNFKEIARR